MRLIIAIFVCLVAFGLVRRDHGTWKEYVYAAILSAIVCLGIFLV